MPILNTVQHHNENHLVNSAESSVQMTLSCGVNEKEVKLGHVTIPKSSENHLIRQPDVPLRPCSPLIVMQAPSRGSDLSSGKKSRRMSQQQSKQSPRRQHQKPIKLNRLRIPNLRTQDQLEAEGLRLSRASLFTFGSYSSAARFFGSGSEKL